MYNRKKTGVLGLQGIEIKSLEQTKTTGEKILLGVSHFGSSLVGAVGGAGLGRWGLGAGAVTFGAAAFLSEDYPRVASHMMAAGGGMMAGPALVAVSQPQQQSIEGFSGFDLDRELDNSIHRAKALGTGLQKSIWWDKISQDRPAASIEQEAAKAVATATKEGQQELGRVVQYTLPEAQKQQRPDYMSESQQQAIQQFTSMAVAI